MTIIQVVDVGFGLSTPDGQSASPSRHSFVGRGPDKRVAVNAEASLGETNADVTDKAMDICPVGALMPKRVGYKVPVGQRTYDHQPIGSDVEQAEAKE